MTAHISELYRAAFSRVSAYIIMKNGQPVARIAFKHSGAGTQTTYAYVHWFGVLMVRGKATGGGYDKSSAACWDAVTGATFLEYYRTVMEEDKPRHLEPGFREGMMAFKAVLEKDGSKAWDAELVMSGFTVIQAI